MSTNDPSGPQPEGGGKPSFDKQSPQSGGGTPEGKPSDPYGNPPPADAPQDRPGAYGGTYGGPPQGAPGYGQPPYGQDPYGQPPHGQHPPGRDPNAYGTPTGGPVPGMPPLGSWPNRILARIIDYLLVQVVAILVLLPFARLGDRSGETGAFWLACALYFVYEGLMLSRDGQTLGKKAMKVRVAMLVDGNSPTQSAAWTRAAVFILPAVLCCAILWWIIDGLFGVFDKPYRQCIHDKAAKTVVVSTA
ncbi:RDD family protein [Streptomyces sp. SP17BM10]|uniref:RDD family protein n=1 Tax=Streptomyces sp. SP17BM10 TaxID=3002530 RepID=UPI002E79A995|nr:RDD family protein [Streptomyces sp. SP17BM10]MEE1785952.1 RDD family protein [Streptomyces sp. SP17BM10]